jgi:hypothetical protein
VSSFVTFTADPSLDCFSIKEPAGAIPKLLVLFALTLAVDFWVLISVKPFSEAS